MVRSGRKRRANTVSVFKGKETAGSTKKLKLKSGQETSSESSDMKINFSCLPDIPIFLILSFLNLSEVLNFAHTCKTFYDMCINSKQVWDKAFENEHQHEKHTLSDQQILFIAKTWQSKKLLQLERYLLHIACKYGNLKVIKFIVNTFEPDVNDRHKDGRVTPLHIAVKYRHLKVVRYLAKECGAKVDSTAKVFELEEKDYGSFDLSGFTDEHTPLHVAIHYRHFRIADCLVNECGADANIISEYDRRPIHLAIINGDLQAVKCLVEKCGVDVNYQRFYEESYLLSWAVHRNNLPIVKYLVQKGADPNEEDEADMKPEEYARDPRIKAFLKSVTQSETDSS